MDKKKAANDAIDIQAARAQAYMDNQPIYNAALAAAGAIATELRKRGQRLCDCGSAPQGMCCCMTVKPHERPSE